MAKIYETKEDLERDRLSKEAQSARESTDAMLSLAALSASGGSAYMEIGQLTNEINQMHPERLQEGFLSRNFSKFNKILGLAGIGVGLAAFVTSFYTRNKTEKAEQALDKLGPEEVVLPNDTTSSPKNNGRTYGMDDVQIIPDSKNPKNATIKMKLDTADFKDLEEKLNADKSVNWQKKVEGEEKTISLTAQKI